MNLFYCNNLSSNTILLNEEESNHCIKVLRKKVGESINLFDGKGTSAKAIINAIGKKHVETLIQERTKHSPDPYKLHIAIAPTKNRNKIEWFVEKAVELGIHELTFFTSYHSERRELKLDRIQKIILAACKQSKAYYLPRLNPIISLDDLINDTSLHKTKLIATLTESASIIKPKKNDDVILLIGPEGGFSKQEVKKAETKNFTSVSLGNKRLRTETSALFCVSMYHQIHLA